MKRYLKRFGFTASVIAVHFVTACSPNEKNQEFTTGEADTKTDTPLFPKGERTAADKFVGEAYLHPLLPRDSNNNL
jgi:hypothetical protein